MKTPVVAADQRDIKAKTLWISRKRVCFSMITRVFVDIPEDLALPPRVNVGKWHSLAYLSLGLVVEA